MCVRDSYSIFIWLIYIYEGNNEIAAQPRE